MQESFDPYLQWLGIRDPNRPPNHYRLLGIDPLEADPNVIANAADRQMAHVRTFHSGKHADVSQRILNELAVARLCLLKPEKKAAYDSKLREQLRAAVPAPPVTAAVASSGAWDQQAPAQDEVELTIGSSRPPRLPRKRSASKSNPMLGWVVLAGTVTVAVIVYASVAAYYRNQRIASAKTGSAQKGAGLEPGDSGAAAQTHDTRPAPQTPTKQPIAQKHPDEESAKEGRQEQPAAAQDDTDSPDHGNEPMPDAESTAADSATTEDDSSAAADAGEPGDSQIDVDAVSSTPEALHAARQAFADRDVATGQKLLHKAASLAASKDRAELDRLQLLADYLGQFWDATAKGADSLATGDELLFNRAAVTVIEKQPDAVVLKGGNGKEVHFPIGKRKINAQLAASLAERGLHDAGAMAPLCLGAFWALDGKGNREQARRLWQQAAEQGQATELLLAELEPAESSVESPEITRDKAVKVAPASTTSIFGPPPIENDTRDEMPSADAQKAALQKVKDVFRREFDSAKSPDKQVALAKTLLDQASQSSGDSASQYILLRQAADQATNAGDATVMLAAIDELQQHFKIDGLQEKYDALSKVGKHLRKPGALAELREAANGVIDDAIQADRFELAAQFAQLAAGAAKGTKNRDAIKDANSRKAQVLDLQKAYKEAATAADRLQADAADAEANLKVGKFFCLVRQDWPRGMPFLARGSDPKLQGAAQLELDEPTDSAKRVQLADAWCEAIGGNARFRATLQARAVHWYQKALPDLAGLEKTRVEKLIGSLESTASGDSSAAPKVLTIALDKDVKLVFHKIPAGKFLMGSPVNERDRKENETPHMVTITRPFYIGVTEVTQAQWKAVMGKNPSSTQDGKLPVQNVSWDDCQKFCQALQRSGPGSKYRFRLPTEAEWEYACRAGAPTSYYFGNDVKQLQQIAWVWENGLKTPHPVGQLKPNAWGLFDMSGNVAEWCSDYFGEYEASAQINPTGPRTGANRCQRGGSAWEVTGQARCACRQSSAPSETRDWLGLRLVVEVP